MLIRLHTIQANMIRYSSTWSNIRQKGCARKEHQLVKCVGDKWIVEHLHDFQSSLLSCP